jgi:hypothetical protein
MLALDPGTAHRTFIRVDQKHTESDLDEEEVLKCVKQVGTVLHDLMSEGRPVEAVIGALNMRFIEMLNDRSGAEIKPVDVKVLFPTLSKGQWEQTEFCHARMKISSEALQAEGFSVDAIMWSLIAAVRNLLRMSAFASDDIDKVIGDLLLHFNAARRPPVIHL